MGMQGDIEWDNLRTLIRKSDYKTLCDMIDEVTEEIKRRK